MDLTRYRTKEDLILKNLTVPAGQAIQIKEYDMSLKIYIIRYNNQEDFISEIEAKEKLIPIHI